MKWPFVSRAAFAATREAFDFMREERDYERRETAARVKDADRVIVAVEQRAEAYNRIIGGLQTQLLDERKRYDDLLARYHMLKLQGFTAPAPAPTATTPPAVDPIAHAINLASAGKDARVRRGMVKQAKIDSDAGVSVDDIIARIQRGNRPAEDVG